MIERSFRVALSISPHTEDFIQGAYAEQRFSGVWYVDDAIEARTADDLQRLYMGYGTTEVYARIATTRDRRTDPGAQTLLGGLDRARLANELGLRFNPEFGLWGTYGDITRQPHPDFEQFPQLGDIPPWHTLTIDEMVGVMRDYGALMGRELADSGADIVAVNIGNEVDAGVAGLAPRPLDQFPQDGYRAPDRVDPEIGRMGLTELIVGMSAQERLTWLREHVWPHEARVLGAFEEGLRTGLPNVTTSTHLSGGLGLEGLTAFWESMRDNGYLPDELGTSYYPSNGSSMGLGAFQHLQEALAQAFDRPIFIAEYAYPATGHWRAPGQFADWNTTQEGYPLTEEGQNRLLEDLTRWAVESGVISGIRPWAPEGVIDIWDPLALFQYADDDGPARPRQALGAIARVVEAHAVQEQDVT